MWIDTEKRYREGSGSQRQKILNLMADDSEDADSPESPLLNAACDGTGLLDLTVVFPLPLVISMTVFFMKKL